MPEPRGPDPGQISSKRQSSFHGDGADHTGGVGGSQGSTTHGPEPDELTRALYRLVEQIDGDAELSNSERNLATAKVEAVAYALRRVDEQPGRLAETVLDASVYLTARAEWAWPQLRSILRTRAARDIVARIAEAGRRAEIDELLTDR